MQVSLTIVHREPPTHIHGQKLANMHHRGDIAKIEVLVEYGGIYLDYDVIVVNNLNPLRRYDVTLGKSFSLQAFSLFRAKNVEPIFDYSSTEYTLPVRSDVARLLNAQSCYLYICSTLQSFALGD